MLTDTYHALHTITVYYYELSSFTSLWVPSATTTVLVGSRYLPPTVYLHKNHHPDLSVRVSERTSTSRSGVGTSYSSIVALYSYE